MENIIPRSFIAGIMIAISDYIYLNADNKIVAAFIFPLALITILKNRMYLYTGVVGNTFWSWTSIGSVIAVLIGNALGLSILCIPTCTTAYQEFFQAKLAVSFNDVLIKSMFCGALMYIAVKFTNNNTSYLLTILCVAGFLLGKCEHSVADIGYLFASRTFTPQALFFILKVVAGNALGAILLNYGIRNI